jgi:glycosyltransferase involved in cell wall biosynthesis
MDSPHEKIERGSFRKKHPECQGKKLIVFLSRIDPKKGLELLIRSLLQVGRVRDDFFFVVAGLGRPAYELGIRRMVHDSPLNTRTLFTGFLEGEEKFSLLRDADLFVLPSYHENFGIAMVEAMGMGVPVLVTPGVHLSSLVEGQRAGRVSGYDENEISRHVTELLDNEKLRMELGKNGRKLVLEKFSWSVIAPQIKALYEKIVREKP